MTDSIPYEEDYSKRLAILHKIIRKADTGELFYIHEMLSNEFRARYERVLGMKAEILNLQEQRCINAFMCDKRKLPTSQEKLSPTPEYL